MKRNTPPNRLALKFWNAGAGRRWGHLGPLFAGVVLTAALQPSPSWALALGKLSASSHMGERLLAEIAIPEATQAEISSLKTSLANPQMYESLGIEFSPALLGAEASLQQRTDGQYYIRITTPAAINDPFVNLVVVATWSSGRIVRDYALLLDPPGLAQKAPVVVVTPAITAATPNAPASANEASNATPVAAAPVVATPKAEVPDKQALSDKKPTVETAAAKPKQLTVVQGMTAGQIAAQVKPANVSLDQMLAMLLQANPDAFIKGNINLIRAGAVIDIPGSEQAGTPSTSSAQKFTNAETKDFEEYKRRLATIAKASDGEQTNSKSTGKIVSKVTEDKPSAVAPDKLRLSTSDKDKKPDDTKLVATLQAKEDAARRAALNENINSLNKLSSEIGKPTLPASGSTPQPSTSTTAASSATVVASATAAVGVPAATASSSDATNQASAPASAPVTPTVTSVPPKAITPPAAPVEESAGMFSELLGNPFLLPGAAGLIALLLVLTYVRRLKQKKEATEDSSFFDSRLRQDSFFAESGGQTIDTQNAALTTTNDSTRHTSESYTSTQMNQTTDVDPIAEADVYLAYGRDMQAEEILKDAMVLQPTRLAIPLKLMELYAKHGETNDFEKLAEKVKSMTESTGPEWNRVQDLRKVLNSNIKSSAEAGDLAVSSQHSRSVPNASKSEGERSIWFDNDASSSLQTGNSIFAPSKLPIEAPSATRLAEVGPQSQPSDMPPISAPPNSKFDFDFSSLSLDLKSTPSTPPSESAQSELSTLDTWQTKLALAKEFQTIGDIESARKLAQEVIGGSNEAVKEQARALLAELS